MRIQCIGMFAAPFLLLLLTLGTPTAADAKAWQAAKGQSKKENDR